MSADHCPTFITFSIIGLEDTGDLRVHAGCGVLLREVDPHPAGQEVIDAIDIGRPQLGNLGREIELAQLREHLDRDLALAGEGEPQGAGAVLARLEAHGKQRQDLLAVRRIEPVRTHPQRAVDHQHRADPLDRAPLLCGAGRVLPAEAVDQQRQPPPLGHPGDVAADADGILQQRRDDFEIGAALGPHGPSGTGSLDGPPATGLGADYIATGHYAQVRETNGMFQLLKGEDGTKDQSYFLYRLNQAQLTRTLFPIGHLYKRDVRKIARDQGLPNFSKKDSTGICFIGERPFREFLNRYLPNEPGEIRTPTGTVVGKHAGLMYYTIGQRQGLGIGGTRDGDGEPWFVSDKDMARNILTVVQGHDHPDLFSPALTAADLTWISGGAPHCNWVYAAKIRYRQDDQACRVEACAAGHPDTIKVIFAQPQRAVTPGQTIVFYQDELCLGGAVIEQYFR